MVLCKEAEKIVNSYIDVFSAFIDVLDGQSAWKEIQAQTGLSEKRCKEIEEIFNNIAKRMRNGERK